MSLRKSESYKGQMVSLSLQAMFFCLSCGVGGYDGLLCVGKQFLSFLSIALLYKLGSE